MSLRHIIFSTGLGLLALCIGALGLPQTSSTAASTATTANAPEPTVEFVNSLGGAIRTLDLSGTVAYVGEGMALVALDVSNPAQPVRRSRLPLPATVRDMQVISDTAYLANDVYGLHTVDVRQPDALVSLGSAPTPGAALSIAVVDQRVYLACGTGGLWIFDVSDPAHPTVLGSYAGTAHDVAVVGNVAAIVDGDLHLLDISNPALPTLVGSYLTPGEAKTVDLSETVAYLADEGGLGVATVDLSNPASPVLLGTIAYSGYGGAVSVAGAYAYIQMYTFDILSGGSHCVTQMIDRSDPRQLTVLGTWLRQSFDGQCTGKIQVVGDRAYEANGHVQIVHLSDPQNPTVEGTYLPLVQAKTVAIAKNLAYVTDSDRGLMILDVTNPLSPTVLGRYATEPGRPHHVYVQGSRAYVTTQDPSHPRFPAGRLLVIDVSNPQSPVLLSTFATGGAGQFIIKGDRAYVMVGRAGFTSRLAIVDLSNPFALTELGSYGPYTQTLSLEGAASSYVYLRAFDFGVSDPKAYLQVLDASEPTTPTIQSSLAISPTSHIVAMGDGALYAATDGPELQIFDVSDPLAPHVRATWSTSDTIALMTVVDNHAYAVTQGGELQILDVSQAFSPTVRLAWRMPNAPLDIEVEGDTIYTITGDGQLQIMRYTTSVSATLSSAGGTLVSLPDTTSYAFASGSFTGTVVVKHTTRAAANLPPTGHLVGIGHAFENTALDSTTRQTVQPLLPYTLTVQYQPTALGTAIENTLGLYYWNGTQWVEEPSTVDPTTQTITAHPRHFSTWAVLGQTRRVYVPLTVR